MSQDVPKSDVSFPIPDKAVPNIADFIVETNLPAAHKYQHCCDKKTLACRKSGKKRVALYLFGTQSSVSILQLPAFPKRDKE